MKILLVRTIAVEEDLSKMTYNNQGIGLAIELSKLGHECALVYYAKKGKGFEETITVENENIKVYHIEGKNLVWNAIFEKKLYDIAENYDIIQTSECDQIASYLLYKHFPNKTIIYHGPYKSKYTKKYNLRSKVFDFIFLNRSNFKNAEVITKSYLAEDYLRNKGFKNVTTLGVGLNVNNFNNEDLNLPQNINDLIANKMDNKYILYIGAISKRKNFLFIIEILNILVNIKNKKDFKLIVVGNKAYKEEKYFDKCMNLVKEYKLENNFIYLGTVEQKYIKDLYKISNVYVLATQYDIFGMVYLEAMYFETPIVTTLCGGSSLLIKDGETGYIKNNMNSNEWANSIIDIIEDKDNNLNMGKLSHKLISENYLWSKLAPKFVDIYNKKFKN